MFFILRHAFLRRNFASRILMVEMFCVDLTHFGLCVSSHAIWLRETTDFIEHVEMQIPLFFHSKKFNLGLGAFQFGLIMTD